MTCPACQAKMQPPAAVKGLTICSRCLRSLVVVRQRPRMATAADVQALPAADLAALRALRPRQADPSRVKLGVVAKVLVRDGRALKAARRAVRRRGEK